MSVIENSRAAYRSSERMLTAKGKLRAAWASLDLGWSFSDVMDYLVPGAAKISEPEKGKIVGLATSFAMIAVEQDRDRQERDAGESDGTFQIKHREDGVVAPFGGDRMWGALNGENYCVLQSRDELGPGDHRWHLSVSNERHLRAGHEVPLWRDFVAIVHQLRPGVPFVIGIPPRNQWMNKNPNVLHALETHDHALIEMWRLNAAAVAGTDAAVPS